MPNFILQPDSSVVICTGSQVPVLSAFGAAVSVTSFPSLGNDGDQLVLLAPNSSTMHAVAYSIDWYQNALKSEGGWTLEMIDVRNPCGGIENWRASNDPKGGTPGRLNSVNNTNADNLPPQLVNAFAGSPNSITLRFNEPLDSLSAAAPAAYSLSNGIAITSAMPQAPFFTSVVLNTNNALVAGQVYTVSANGVTDCRGLPIGANNSSRVGLASAADSNDVVVNEILFNPFPLGVDYVEIYNRSNKIINLRQLVLANRSSSTGQLGSFTNLSNTDQSFFPGEWLVFTTDTGIVRQQYTVLNPKAMNRLSSLPSYPDDKGWVVVLNGQGAIVDEVPYTEKWHFPLITNEEGVALERIDYNGLSNSRENWTSAASSAKFGTPTSENSQHRIAGSVLQGEITVSPRLFSPDNDGFEDFALIQFRFPEPGYVANINIMDASGRQVRLLQRNATCGATGSFRWDGLNDKQQRLPVGTYIVVTEIFNLQGQKSLFKNTVSIARKF
jgi:hypothetical protein